MQGLERMVFRVSTRVQIQSFHLTAVSIMEKIRLTTAENYDLEYRGNSIFLHLSRNSGQPRF